jgi:hypothetical protein
MPLKINELDENAIGCRRTDKLFYKSLPEAAAN